VNDPVFTRLVRVEGLVQGVGYRAFTRHWALRLNLSGWVRNCSDGAVEALLRGPASDVEAMLAQMRSGALEMFGCTGTNLDAIVPVAGITSVGFAFKDAATGCAATRKSCANSWPP